LMLMWLFRAAILAAKGAYMGRPLHKSCPKCRGHSRV